MRGRRFLRPSVAPPHLRGCAPHPCVLFEPRSLAEALHASRTTRHARARSPVRGKAEPIAKVMVRGKAMADKAGDMMAVVRDVLLSARLDDKARFSQMVAETKAGMESGVIAGGHSFAARRLNAQMSAAGYMSEQGGGWGTW
eukprot:363131-Chlamydomonas_euryale.AAC.2